MLKCSVSLLMITFLSIKSFGLGFQGETFIGNLDNDRCWENGLDVKTESERLSKLVRSIHNENIIKKDSDRDLIPEADLKFTFSEAVVGKTPNMFLQIDALKDPSFNTKTLDLILEVKAFKRGVGEYTYTLSYSNPWLNKLAQDDSLLDDYLDAEGLIDHFRKKEQDGAPYFSAKNCSEVKPVSLKVTFRHFDSHGGGTIKVYNSSEIMNLGY